MTRSNERPHRMSRGGFTRAVGGALIGRMGSTPGNALSEQKCRLDQLEQDTKLSNGIKLLALREIWVWVFKNLNMPYQADQVMLWPTWKMFEKESGYKRMRVGCFCFDNDDQDMCPAATFEKCLLRNAFVEAPCMFNQIWVKIRDAEGTGQNVLWIIDKIEDSLKNHGFEYEKNFKRFATLKRWRDALGIKISKNQLNLFNDPYQYENPYAYQTAQHGHRVRMSRQRGGGGRVPNQIFPPSDILGGRRPQKSDVIPVKEKKKGSNFGYKGRKIKRDASEAD